ncbi:hypothetical protein J2T55_000572 [Methylohalomonas lacus]|uniref:Uncharacterized protein n=1 Tax=Methylohalomonas lacus TaxID=398773 RepID=A0AAE3HJZ2_9GAMM|nr:hypothetical protein [Methylohalomonas lacus]MCS3902568.1 hypothetical protein [Methylohalomonas lacus]
MKRTRTMAYTHAEFKRLLPHALQNRDYSDRGRQIEANDSGTRILIQLGDEYERRIASLSMPVCDVTLELQGFSDDQAQAFLDKFDRTYRRGGG